MKTRWHEIIRRHCQPLEPIPTGEAEVPGELVGLRAVLFDVYGTLFISASGDIGSAGPEGRGDALVAALDAVGVPSYLEGEPSVRCLQEIIRERHERARRDGIDHPEVEIRAIWSAALAAFSERGWLEAEVGAIDLERLAVEYEVRTNPVWPMPGLEKCLRGLAQQGVALGMVSNAQFFTAELFPALLGHSPQSLGFDPELCHYSFLHGRAKPGRFLHELAARSLASRGIGARETLYVGNDMLNDILPAREVRFRTALFAGDARSLRRREDDPRVRDLVPDMVLTDLAALLRCPDP